MLPLPARVFGVQFRAAPYRLRTATHRLPISSCGAAAKVAPHFHKAAALTCGCALCERDDHGFARIEGRVVGIVANQPKHLGGVLFVDSADKAARFIWLCDAFEVPLLYLADVPGS